MKLLLQFILLLFFVTSCNISDPNNSKIRIVDLQGRPTKVKRYVPELNAKLIKEQNTSPTIKDKYFAENTDLDNSQNISQDKIINDNIKNAEIIRNNLKNKKKYDIEYDMSQEILKTEKKEAKKATKSKKESKKYAKKGNKKHIYLQIGSFRTKISAQRQLKKAKKSLFSGKILKRESKSKIYYKVILGPLKNINEAKFLRRKSKKRGYRDAFIIKIK